MSPFYEDLSFRGLIKQMTDERIPTMMNQGGLTLYAGFDPTADSLHIGHLLPLLTLSRFQRAGHKPIAVLGGATGMIGDPSFKDQERSLLTREQIAHNSAGIKKNLERFLDFSGQHAATLTNNHDWFEKIGFVDFLRDTGKHFTINHMTAKESVRSRLEDREHGLSFTEFSYMLLQAYDFLHLCRQNNCTLQIGGSDQWGNITAGIDLIRRVLHKESFGLTLPLVLKADGTKFGKSESGAVWLSAEKTSPYEFYQYLIQTSDADVGMMLRYFTFLSHEEILALEETVKSAPEKREAQTKLAQELTKMVHGEAELAKVQATTTALFTGDLRGLDLNSLMSAFKEAPHVEQARSALAEPGALLVDLLVTSGLCASKGMARKDLESGGIYVNNEREKDATKKITPSQLLHDQILVLRKGKKSYSIIVFK